MIFTRALFAAVALCAAAPAAAQQAPWRLGYGPQGAPFAFWPGVRYDASIPTLKSVVGHASGDEITRPEDIIRYFEALAAAAATRIKVFEYARSWENRPLIYAIVGSPANIAKLTELKAGMQTLASPRSTNESAAAELIENLPGTAWFAAGVHGDEISSSDAAIMAAYHLVAARGDPTVDKILANTVVFIDPLQNPDGRARFVQNFAMARGLEPSGEKIAAERNEPWPTGRTNHYLFDMNRDWFAMTQPETIGRIRILREWMPLAFVDAHEMQTDSTYFFSPEANPFNPHLAAGQRASLELFGRNNAKWFDRYGFDYYTREVYDAFYPGYGASWPSYYGSVAMTFEQASAAGLKARRTSGAGFDYRDTVRQHFVAAISTAETVASNRAKLLKDFWDYRRSAIEEGQRDDVRSYIFPAGVNDSASYKIAGLLTQQGVEVKTATADFSACGENYKAGTHVVSLAQPAKRLARTLLDPDVPIEAAFLQEQERLRGKKLPDQIYDVTAWSLPLMFNAAMESCAAGVGAGADFRLHNGRLAKRGTLAGAENAIAYLVPWGEVPAVKLLARAHREGLAVRSSDKAFRQGATLYPAGSLIFMANGNPPDLRTRLTAVAAETGADVIAVAESWVTEGPNYGSENVFAMPAPRIAVAWDEPVNPSPAGHTRFVIERQFGYPATAVRAASLGDRTLSNFDVLVLPSGGDYARVLGPGGVARLKEWVNAGGVLVATGASLRFLSHPDIGLLSVKREEAPRSKNADDEDAAKKETVPGAFIASSEEAEKAILPKTASPDSSAGILARARVDEDHWLGAGVAQTLNVLVTGGDIYQPITLDKGVNVARFAGPEAFLASGYLWDETKRQYAYKPFAIAEPAGDGVVIAFTQDPNYRAYMDGLNIIFANALFRGPAHVTPAR